MHADFGYAVSCAVVATAEAEAAKRDAEESKKADASRKAEASKKAAAKKKAAVAKAKAEAAKHPFKAVEEAAAVDGLKVSESGKVLFAKFPIADNLTKGLIRSGTQRSTVDVLKAVSENTKGYTKVFVQGTFPMQDQYGNGSDSIILNVGYDKKTVGMITFDGVNPDGIWGIRDGGMVHPELQK